MKTAAQKYSESNAEAILAYFRGVDGTFVPTPAHPSPRYPMVDDTVGIHTVRLSQSTLAGYLEQAFVAGERAEFGRITGKKSPFKREGLHSHEEPMPGRHSPWNRDCPQCVADKLISQGNVPGVEDSCVEEPEQLTGKPLPPIAITMLERMLARQNAIAIISGKDEKCEVCGGDHKDYMVHGATLPTRKLSNAVDELIRHDESRTDEKLLQAIAAADAEADRLEGRTPKHGLNLGAYRNVFDADGEQ
jgi:hypothetical protein